MEDSDSGSESDGEGTKKPSGIEFDKINFDDKDLDFDKTDFAKFMNKE